MFRFRILVSICFFVGVVGCLVFNKTDQFSSPPAGDASFSCLLYTSPSPRD